MILAAVCQYDDLLLGLVCKVAQSHLHQTDRKMMSWQVFSASLENSDHVKGVRPRPGSFDKQQEIPTPNTIQKLI